jgi:hypothetical protein
MNRLIIIVLITTVSETYCELKKNFSLNAETNIQYDGNLLYPDSITNEGSMVSITTIRPSLLLQPDKMSMFKISASGSYAEQFKPSDHSFTTGLNIQYKRFLSNRSMFGAVAAGSLSESNNSLLDERSFAGEVQGGRYLTPYTNLSGIIAGTIKSYPGFYKIDGVDRSYFYNFFDLKPQLSLSVEHSMNFSCRYELSGFFRKYYDDNHAYEFIDSIQTDSIDHIDLNGDGSYDTIFVLKAIPSANVTKERDYGIRTSLSADYSAADWLSLNFRIDGLWQESNDSYYVSREVNSSVAAELEKNRNILILTLSYGLAYFPDRGINYFEKTPFAGIIIKRTFTSHLSAELNGAYRLVNSSNEELDYSKPIVTIKMVWKK